MAVKQAAKFFMVHFNLSLLPYPLKGDIKL